MRLLLLFLFFLYCNPKGHAQQITEQFTVNNGLQSNEVYQIEKDKYGHLWMCSDRGLVSFNGNEFSYFDVTNGLRYPNVTSIYKLQNTLFFSEFNGGISYLDNTNSVKQHWLSDLVKPYLKMYRYFIQAVEKDNLLYLSYKQLGVLVIDMKLKKVVKLIQRKTKSPTLFIVEENGLNLLIESNYNSNFTNEFTLSISTKKLKFKKQYKRLSGVLLYFINRKNGGYCFLFSNYLFEIDAKGNLYKSTLPKTLLRLQESEKNELILSFWQGGIEILKPNSLYKDQQKKLLFNSISTTSICYDNENGTWISTHGNGIYYLSPKKLTFEKIVEDNVAQNTFDLYSNNNKLYLNKNDESLYEVINKNVHLKHDLKKEYNSLLTVGGKDCLIGFNSILINNKNSEKRSVMFSNCFSRVIYKNYLLLANFGSVTFIDITDNFNALIFNRSGIKRVTSLELVNNDLYIGTTTGLFWVENFTDYLTNRSLLKTIKPTPLKGHPGFEEAYVKDIIHKKNQLYIATIGSGLLVYNTSTEQLTKIEKKDGLFSNNLEDLDLVGNSIFTISFNGINEIKQTRNHFKIRKFASSKELKINNPFRIHYFKGFLYLLHSSGLGRLNLDVHQTHSKKNIPCYITEIQSDNIHFKGIVNKFPSTIKLKKSTDLIIRFEGISYQLGKSTLFKYRLIGWDNHWKLAKNKYLSFPNLNSGNYKLEIVALDEMNNMSTSKAEVAFEIIPAFYKSTTFIVIILVLALGLFITFYLLRFRYLENKMKFNVINQKATVAQINPHFIFNILNSINSDILLKDKKNASKTLVNFSNLMRQNLYNSAHALVSLENDLDALKFYLILEQNRMENFDFDIQLSHDVNVHQLLVPPMLIQPFVENVLRHAFINKTEENRGEIIVSIQLIEDNLCCSITDDGIGINQSLKNKEKSPLKKSMGMSITKERLVFLTKYYKKTFKLEITDKSDAGSHGTNVCFYLPFNRK